MNDNEVKKKVTYTWRYGKRPVEIYSVSDGHLVSVRIQTPGLEFMQYYITVICFSVKQFIYFAYTYQQSGLS